MNAIASMINKKLADNTNYIIIGGSKSENKPCGVEIFSNGLAKELNQLGKQTKSILTIKKWKFENSLDLLLSALSDQKVWIIINMNTRSYSRSIELRLCIYLLCFLKKPVCIILHEDLLSTPIRLIANNCVLFAKKRITNRPLYQYSAISQKLLACNYNLVDNPAAFSENVAYNVIHEASTYDKNKKVNLAVFGLVSYDKGFDNAIEVTLHDEPYVLYIFSDLELSSEVESEYRIQIAQKIQDNTKKIKLLGKPNLCQPSSIQSIKEVDIGLFLYNKQAGIWNTTLRTCVDIGIPVLAVNKTMQSGWDLEQKIYYIPEYKLELAQAAVRKILQDKPRSRRCYESVRFRSMKNYAADLVSVLQ